MKKPANQNHVNLPEKLKAWRKDKGYTQEQAYKKLGCPRRTYENWEMGVNVPHGFALKALLKLIQ